MLSAGATLVRNALHPVGFVSQIKPEPRKNNC
jgi:hypothetical protein